MNARIEKDVRLVLPPWLLAVALVTVAALVPHSFDQGWIIAVVVFAWLIIAASVFGGEFAHGTIPQLLTQPIDRRRVWRDKMIVLAIAQVSLFLAVLALEYPHLEKSATVALAVVPICTFCTMPFYSFVGRGTLSAIILAIPLPGIIFVAGAGAILWLFRSGALDATDPYMPINEERLHFWVNTYFGVVLPAYCGLLYYLGYRRFLNLDVAEGGQRQIRLPKSMLAGLEHLANRVLPNRLGYLRALVVKELHLQHSATVLFLIFCVLQILALLYVKLAQPSAPENYFTVPLFIYCAVMPLVIGSCAIAEETHLGTRAWHLALPCSARTQWAVKLGIALLFCWIFSVVIPLVWYAVGRALGVPGLDWPESEFGWAFVISVTLLTLMAFYASSFSGDTLHALLTAFGLGAGLIFITGTVMGTIERWPIVSPAFLQQFSTSIIDRLLSSGWLVWIVPPACLAFLLLRYSYLHYRTIDRQRVWAKVPLVFLPGVFLLFILVSLGLAARKLQ